ncbi:MAG: InlB B-repeat-containing protein [Clostridia bacterium]|nr:InlB B-repeat-containing protein [Clostridia bacterium]
MEKITSWCCSKKTKLIISTIAIIVVLSLIFAISFAIQKSPLVATYRVEYVKDVDDVIVQTYYKGQKIVFPENPEKAGYEFVGWSLDMKGSNFVTQDMFVEEEITFYAKWVENSFVLSYNDMLYSLNSKNTIKIVDDGLMLETSTGVVFIENPNKSDCIFSDWQIKNGDNVYALKDFDFSSVDDGETIYLVPKFESVFVNVSILANMNEYEILGLEDGLASIDRPLEIQLVLNESVNKSNVTITSTCGVLNFSKSGNLYNIKLSDFSKDVVIYIDNISINKYNITYNNDGEISVYSVLHGQSLEFPKFERAGFSLVGIKDSAGRYYSEEFVVKEDLSLILVWQEDVYQITLPKSNGMYVISVDDEYWTASKTIQKNYGDSVSFKISLSSAYSNSSVSVYAISDGNYVYPMKNDDEFVFENITSDMQVVIDGVVLNSYSVYVDGVSYGKFAYGSWIYVDDANIKIKDIESLQITNITTLVEDESFGGWRIGSEVLVNSIIQDVSNDDGLVEILGDYSKNVARVKLIANGGILDITEVVIVEGEELLLPTPTKYGYKFAGWFVKLVEVNTVVDEESSEKFEGITDFYMILYAGWQLDL